MHMRKTSRGSAMKKKAASAALICLVVLGSLALRNSHNGTSAEEVNSPPAATPTNTRPSPVARHTLNTQQQATLGAWLKRHPGRRRATAEDCNCRDRIEMLTGATSGRAEPDYDPYLAVGDLNGDGTDDFAVLMVNAENLGYVLLVFNGPFNDAPKAPAFSTDIATVIDNSVIFYDPQKAPGFSFGELFTSEGLWISPDKNTYRVDQMDENASEDTPPPPTDADTVTVPVFHEPAMATIPAGNYEVSYVADGRLVRKDMAIQSFQIGKFEVTQGLWRSVMGIYDNPSFFSTCGDDCPVEGLSLKAAQTFVQRLTKRQARNTVYRPRQNGNMPVAAVRKTSSAAATPWTRSAGISTIAIIEHTQSGKNALMATESSI